MGRWVEGKVGWGWGGGHAESQTRRLDGTTGVPRTSHTTSVSNPPQDAAHQEEPLQEEPVGCGRRISPPGCSLNLGDQVKRGFFYYLFFFLLLT